MYYVCNRDIYKPFMIKEIKRKSREHIKKRKRKSMEQKRGKENKRKNERN